MDKKNISEKLSELNKKASEFVFPRWADFPSVGLYMDQVTELVNGFLEKIPSFPSENSAITASMINNYVKSNIMPAPEKKRYSKEHLAYIMVICTLKQTFNMSTIEEILGKTFSEDDISAQYDLYASDFEDSCKIAIADISSGLKNSSDCKSAGILKLMSEISAKKFIAEKLTEYSM